MTARTEEVLDVPYFHLVFTLPGPLRDLALQNKRLVYGMLFRAVGRTIQQIAADPRHLGATVGILMILHTWGQNLTHHPHVHCVVPSGGISPDRTRWVSGSDTFFLPIRILSRVYRGKFLGLLKQAHRKGQLVFHGHCSHLKDEHEFNILLSMSARRDWVVYAKRPFGGARQVLAYLARYTHRVAISNQRLCALADGKVSFRWKDYTDGGRSKIMTLVAAEFIRRFLLHVLPAGFVRIRYMGFLANRNRKANLELCRKLLGEINGTGRAERIQRRALSSAANYSNEKRSGCPKCDSQHMDVIHVIEPQPPRRYPVRPHFALATVHNAYFDSS